MLTVSQETYLSQVGQAHVASGIMWQTWSPTCNEVLSMTQHRVVGDPCRAGPHARPGWHMINNEGQPVLLFMFQPSCACVGVCDQEP